MKSVFLLLILLSLSYLSKGDTIKCDPSTSIQEQIDQADIIFSGTCIFVNSNWISGGQKYVFQVNQTWKRRVDSLYIVNSKWLHDGGYVFEKDQEYLVYVDKGFTPKTNLCMGNKLLAEAEADLQLLGEGQAPAKASNISLMIWTVSLLGLLSFLILGFILLGNRNKQT